MKDFHIDKYKNISLDKYPDVHKYDDLQRKALWVLWVSEEELGYDYLSAGQIAKVLTDILAISATSVGVFKRLCKAGKRVHRKKRKRTTIFSIMEKGKEFLTGSEDVMLIEPEKAFTDTRSFQEILRALKGNIRICDPWIDPHTLDMLAYISQKSKINLLTVNPQNKKTLIRDYNAFNKQFGNLEIRVYNKGVLHDRYIITGSEVWLLGQSLNGIGKKETFVVRLGTDIKVLLESFFEDRWSKASTLT